MLGFNLLADGLTELSHVGLRPMALLAIRNLSRGIHARRAGRMVAIPDFSLEIDAGESVRPGGQIRLRQIDAADGDHGLSRPQRRHHARAASCSRAAIWSRTDGEALRRIRGSRIAIVYQEPATALNPSMTIGRQLMEVPRRARRRSRRRGAASARPGCWPMCICPMPRASCAATRTSSPAARNSAS